MPERDHWADHLFAALLAAIVVTLLCALVLALILDGFYGRDFPELSFAALAIYFAGRGGVLLLGAALVLGLAAAGITWLLRLARAARPTSAHSRKLAFWVALFFSAVLAAALVFWLNSNFLRYSRELRSYLLDLAMIGIALLCFLLLWRLLPPTRLERRRGIRWTTLLLIAGLAVLRLTGNPFAIERFTPHDTASAEEWRGDDYTPDGQYVGSVTPDAAPRWNLLLLSIDTLRADGLGCYGNARSTSPQIDSLAAQGTRFANALALSSWTLPSHMTMITGLQPSVHGCSASPMWTRTFDRLAERWVTLAEVLRGWGYATAAYTDGRLVGPPFGFDQGFDICDDSGHGIQRIAEKAIAWLAGRPADRPFFLFLHCYDVHRYRPPAEFADQFVAERPERMVRLRERGRELEARLNANAFDRLAPQEVAYIRDLYAAETRKTDAAFGNVLRDLQRRDLYDRTLIVVTSDHGEEFWEHCGTGHGWSLHQHQLRIPLILRAPGLVAAGHTVDVWMGMTDLAPTLLDLLGLPLPSQVQGISLAPWITGSGSSNGGQAMEPEGSQGSDPFAGRVFLAEAAHLGNQKCLVADGHALHFHRFPPLGEDLFDWRRALYVWRNILHAGPSELYDLRSDPDELEDLAARDPERTRRMEEALLAATRSHLARGALRSGSTRGQLDPSLRDHLRSLGYIE